MRLYIDHREAWLLKRALADCGNYRPTLRQECDKLFAKILKCQDLQKSGSVKNGK